MIKTDFEVKNNNETFQTYFTLNYWYFSFILILFIELMLFIILLDIE